MNQRENDWKLLYESSRSVPARLGLGQLYDPAGLGERIGFPKEHDVLAEYGVPEPVLLRRYLVLRLVERLRPEVLDWLHDRVLTFYGAWRKSRGKDPFEVECPYIDDEALWREPGMGPVTSIRVSAWEYQLEMWLDWAGFGRPFEYSDFKVWVFAQAQNTGGLGRWGW